MIYPSYLDRMAMSKVIRAMVVPLRMGVLQREEWNFQIGVDCLFEISSNSMRCLGLTSLLMIKGVVGQLKLALLAHFDLCKCGFCHCSSCHCSSWFATESKIKLCHVASEDQESGSDLAGWYWLRVSHEVEVKMSVGFRLSEGWIVARGPASK